MKIGILTHYYNSNNYGGVLQAYALVKALKKIGFNAEQICFPFYESRPLKEDCIVDIEKKRMTGSNKTAHQKKSFPLRILGKIYRKAQWYSFERKKVIAENNRSQEIENIYFIPRRKAFSDFRNSIPHSSVEYSLNTLFMLNERYDAFITGSDQVWNLEWHTPGSYLEFSDNEKKKIAYAASAGASNFDEVQKKYLARALPRFDAISVRESDLVEIYKGIAGVNAEYVLDPTLLLGKEDWDEIASECLIPEKYVFCFFYNPSEKYYDLAKQYAEKQGLKIAAISYALLDKKIKIDDDFGDYKIGKASPQDFISLIKYADCIFTDSFHCNVFSLIYDIPFFVFSREMKEIKSNSRIISLVELFGCRERCCDTVEKQRLEYISSIPISTYSSCEYVKLKENSINFLKNALWEE